MKYFKRIKLPKREEVKEFKPVKPSIARKVTLIIIVILIISGPIGFLMGKNAVGNVNGVKEDVEILKKDKEKEVVEDTAYTPLFQNYMTPFIKEYINLSDKEELYDKRTENLQKYFPFSLNETDFSGAKRNYVSSELYDLKDVQSFKLATYKVTYDISTTVEKERKVKKKVGKKEKEVVEKYKDATTETVTRLLNVSFQSKDSTFKMVALPYFSDEKDLNSSVIESLDKESDGLAHVEDTETDKINQFISLFLEKYVSGNKEDVMYLMARPEVIKANYTVTDLETEIYEKDGKKYAYATFNFVDQLSKESHAEQMSFLLTTKNKKMYIEKLTHYLGGIVND